MEYEAERELLDLEYQRRKEAFRSLYFQYRELHKKHENVIKEAPGPEAGSDHNFCQETIVLIEIMESSRRLLEEIYHQSERVRRQRVFSMRKRRPSPLSICRRPYC